MLRLTHPTSEYIESPRTLKEFEGFFNLFLIGLWEEDVAGGVEVEKVAIAQLTQKPSDGNTGGPDRVCEVLVRQADDKSMSLGGGLGEFALKQVKEFD